MVNDLLRLKLVISTLAIILTLGFSSALAAEWRICDAKGESLYKGQFFSIKYAGCGHYVVKDTVNAPARVIDNKFQSVTIPLPPGYELEDVFISKANYLLPVKNGKLPSSTLFQIARWVDLTRTPKLPNSRRLLNLSDSSARKLLDSDYASIYRCEDEKYALGNHKTLQCQFPCEFIFDTHDISKSTSYVKHYDIVADFFPIDSPQKYTAKILSQNALVQICEKDRYIAAKCDSVFNPVEWGEWKNWGEHTPIAVTERLDGLKMLIRDRELLGLSKRQIEELFGTDGRGEKNDNWCYGLNRADCGNAEMLLSVFFKDGKVSQWKVEDSEIQTMGKKL